MSLNAAVEKVTLTLFTGPNCHLCEQAKELIYPILDACHGRLKVVDISSSEALKSRYGMLIPTVQFPDGTEKNWPFTAGQLRRLIGLSN